jgi:hypothetical protein
LSSVYLHANKFYVILMQLIKGNYFEGIS